MKSKFNGTTWTYTYDANGMRTKRTNGTTTYTYVYNGGQLTQMTKGNDTLYFTYGAAGPATVTWNGVVYYYVTNIQGDVVAIMNAAGTPVVQYVYDAWGALLSYSGTMRNTLGTLNPLRYRGYLYDSETNLYYLNSRYYNPETGRFINADAYTATGQSFLGNNMFAYCNNNPANRYDPNGYATIQSVSISNEPFRELFFGIGGGGGGGASVITTLTAISLGALLLEQITTQTITVVTINEKDAKKQQQQNQKPILYPPPNKIKYQYWEAEKVGTKVVIGKGLTISEASVRVSCGLSIMCANQSAAQWILVLNGYVNAVGPEIHGEEGFYYHYHPHRNTHTHIWFYS